MHYEFALCGIAVHILQFLSHFFSAPDIEIVKAALPKSGRLAPLWGERQRQLRCRRLSWPSAQGARNFLLEHLQDFRGVALGGLADQQMNVFRHDHITDQLKTVPHADLIQYSHEALAGPGRSEKGTPPIATEGDEMEIAASIKALQR